MLSALLSVVDVSAAILDRVMLFLVVLLLVAGCGVCCEASFVSFLRVIMVCCTVVTT